MHTYPVCSASQMVPSEDPDGDGLPHIVPAIGPEHDVGERCWCRPVRETLMVEVGEEPVEAWVHRTLN